MLRAAICFIIICSLSFSACAGEGAGVNKDAAYMMLKEGNNRFVSGSRTFTHLDRTRLEEVADNGQKPFATVLTCSDSRVPAEHIFDAGIGDLFVVRVAGNVCDTDEIASIEYGAEHLKTPILVVLGHTKCGAVTAVAEGGEFHGNLAGLLDNIKVAVDEVKTKQPGLTGDELVNECVKKNIWVSIEDLFENSPVICELVKKDEILVIGALYDLDTGKVEWLGKHPDEKNLITAPHTAGETVYNNPSQEVLESLKEGNKRFVSGERTFTHLDKETMENVAVNGQKPSVTIISCSDSRVPVEHIFDAGIGDIFTVRVAGNVCDTDEIASIEYGVEHLHTPLLVVLGHTKCGAVTTVAEGTEVHGNLSRLLDNIEVAVGRVATKYPGLTGEELVSKCVEENIWVSIEDLFKRSSITCELVEKGELTIVGAVYDLSTGEVRWLGSHPEQAMLVATFK